MSPSRPLRVYLGAFGDPGHAFPMLALGEALVARGHSVALQTWRRWQEPAEATGIEFVAAPEYQVFPTRDRPLTPYQAAVQAARETVPSVQSFAPDIAVSDVLTPAPALAAELCGVPVATLVPHVYPWPAPGSPPFSLGARLPRTRAGAWMWRRFDGVSAKGLELGRQQYNGCRARLGLSPLPYVHTGLSRALTLVGTLPQLEYPRRWEPWLRVVGPLLWELPGERVEPPPGDGPVVLVAPSTAQDPEHRMLRAALAGLARAPVRVIATHGGRLPEPPFSVPENAVLVPWLSYARTMPAADVVITHGGHGTLARALSCGCALVVCPAGGDMAESAARVDWAGLGVRVPGRLVGERALRLAVQRALADTVIRVRARAAANWIAANDGAQAAARELEAWADRLPHPRP
ncbi:MAG TPA: nucleotide disphospho-sugar-binding domain-containing protein [Solirubrobacteraceae bacterium]|nr:nucleotide disphospho-sugar-binding domain-containing protein [Solirubrobacteraceae bacterium]